MLIYLAVDALFLGLIAAALCMSFFPQGKVASVEVEKKVEPIDAIEIDYKNTEPIVFLDRRSWNNFPGTNGIASGRELERKKRVKRNLNAIGMERKIE